MPRQVIDLPEQVEYLSILDEQGNLDEDLEPDIPNDLLLKLQRGMLLARRFDERMLKLQREGRLGTFAPLKGQEASQIGAVATLRESDWMVQSYRDHAAGLWRGQSLYGYLLVYGGYFQGNQVAEGLRNLPVAVPVSTQTLHAVGLSYAIKYREKDEVVMVFFGDGATSEGDFHEAMNFAGVFQTPVIFVCQNNQWAISIPREHQTRSKTLAQKALAYGMPGIQVDGNDPLAVYTAAQEAVNRARSGDGPTMIECITYRLSLHTTADDPTRYRTDEEVEEWEKRDPIPRFQKYLIDKGLLSEEEISSLEEEITTEIKEAVGRAEKRMQELKDEALSMFDHMYAEMPPYLQEQQEELEEELASAKTEDHNE
jgi:pyruvate dehydrogenase E1 component alpha subunit